MQTVLFSPCGAQCAVVAHSSVLGCVGSLLPIQVALKDLRDSPFQWTFMTGMFPIHAPDNCIRSPGKSPKAQCPGSTLANYNVHLHQAAEQGACDWGPPLQGQVQVPRLPEEPSLRSRDLLSVSGMNLKAWFQMFFCFSTEWLFFLKSSLSQMAVGCVGGGGEIKYIPNCGPLIKWRVSHAWQPWWCPILTHAHQ